MLDQAWTLDYLDQPRLDFDEAVLRRDGAGPLVGRGSSPSRATARRSVSSSRSSARVRGWEASEPGARLLRFGVHGVRPRHRRRGSRPLGPRGHQPSGFRGARRRPHPVDAAIQGHAGSPVVQSTFDRIPDLGRRAVSPEPDLEPPPRSRVHCRRSSARRRSSTSMRKRPKRRRDRRSRARQTSRRRSPLSESLAGQYLVPRNSASGISRMSKPSLAELLDLCGWNSR